MGCSNTKGNLTNSTRMPNKPRENYNTESNQNLCQINSSQNLNENHESIPGNSQQSFKPTTEENKNPVSENIKKEDKNKESIASKESLEKKNLSPREQLRKNANFAPIEKFDKRCRDVISIGRLIIIVEQYHQVIFKKKYILQNVMMIYSN